jgi:hypothetical protein
MSPCLLDLYKFLGLLRQYVCYYQSIHYISCFRKEYGQNGSLGEIFPPNV